MREFEVGDRIKCISDDPEFATCVGWEGVIDHIDDSDPEFPYVVKFDGDESADYWFNEEEMELVED